MTEGVRINAGRWNCGFNGAKGSVYEGGIRVPMVIRWPDGLEGGREISDLIHFTDWLPTLANIAGIERPEGARLDGRNVLNVLRGETADAPPPRFWQWNHYSPIGTSNAAMPDGDCARPATPGDGRLCAR